MTKFSAGAVVAVITVAGMFSEIMAQVPGFGGEVPVIDGHVVLQVSGLLEPNDSQYVQDILCQETGELIGTVRMRWAFKYGNRYGGVGIVTTKGTECVWHGNNGWVRVKLPHQSQRETVFVRSRLAKIPD